jgi:hypothetical protein
MEYPLDRQMLEGAATLLLGLGLGCLYAVLAVLRRRSGRVVSAALDLLFCAVFTGALFACGMGQGRGTLRFFMPPLALGGVTLWDVLFGAATRRATEALLRYAAFVFAILRRPLEILWETAKKFQLFLKNIFSSAKKRFTIIDNNATKRDRRPVRRRQSEETAHETEAFQYIYENRDPGAAGLCRHHPGGREKPHRLRAGRPGRAAGKGGCRAAGKRGAGV